MLACVFVCLFFYGLFFDGLFFDGLFFDGFFFDRIACLLALMFALMFLSCCLLTQTQTQPNLNLQDKQSSDQASKQASILTGFRQT